MFKALCLITLLNLFPTLISAKIKTIDIIKAEDHRQNRNSILTEALNSSREHIVIRSLTALGRLQDPQFIAEVAPLLNHKKGSIRKTAAFALGLIGSKDAYRALETALKSEKKSKVRSSMLLALGRSGDKDSLKVLTKEIINENRRQVKAGAAQGLGLLLTYKLDKKVVIDPTILLALIDLSLKNDKYSPIFAFSLSRYGNNWPSHVQDHLIEQFKNIKNVETKALLCRILGKFDSQRAINILLNNLQNHHHIGVIVESLRALGKKDYTSKFNPLIKNLLQHKNDQIVVQALSTVKRWQEIAGELSTTIQKVISGERSLWIRAEALNTLVAINEVTARSIVHQIVQLRDTDGLRLAAITNIAKLKTRSEFKKTLVQLASSRNPQLMAAVLEVLAEFEENELPDSSRAIIRQALLLGKESVTYFAVELIKKFKFINMAPLLANSFNLNVEGKVTILDGLSVVGTQQELPVVEKALEDPTKQVVEAAAAAYKFITGTDVSHKIPINSHIIDKTPGKSKIRAAVQAHVALKTNKGTIILQMLRAAPLTATKFIRLVKKGFYKGLTFHRVVPNFVAQGGDPNGTGFGGPGFMIRDEVSTIRHMRGTVGIATAGKDTGGSQFFINHAPNLHLDGNYTVFARVVQGMDVVDTIAQGDKILKAWVIQ